MKNWALSVLVFLQAGIALGYPETIRHGYNKACSTCHVSPTGGGVTTDYGRMASEDFASFAPTESAGLLGGALPSVDWLKVGGDTRYMDLQTSGFHKAFLMQNDVELALGTEEVTFAATYGRYGDDGTPPESRRNYVLWRPSPYFSARAGRFFPAYGLGIPDHTAATRGPLGFGEGKESVNAELGGHADFGELFVTGAAGDGSLFRASKDDGSYQVVARGPGALVRASVFVPNATLGASYAIYDRGGHGESQEGIFEERAVLRPT